MPHLHRVVKLDALPDEQRLWLEGVFEDGLVQRFQQTTVVPLRHDSRREKVRNDIFKERDVVHGELGDVDIQQGP